MLAFSSSLEGFWDLDGRGNDAGGEKGNRDEKEVLHCK
jgi:hypothetical protein